MNSSSAYNVGTVLAVVVALLLISSRSTGLKLVGVAFLAWRFALGGCDGSYPIPGVCNAL